VQELQERALQLQREELNLELWRRLGAQGRKTKTGELRPERLGEMSAK